MTLAEIPFVRLRDGLPQRLQGGQAGFAETIAAAQRAKQSPELLIDLAGRRIRVAGERLELEPRVLAFYSLMARRRLHALHPARWTTDGLATQYLDEYRQIVGAHSGDMERAEALLARGMTKELFEQYKSRANRALKDALGPTLAMPYQIQPSGQRPVTCFGLRLTPDAIRHGPLDAVVEGED